MMAAVMLAAVVSAGMAGGGQVMTVLSAFQVAAGLDGREELLPAEKIGPGGIIEYELVCTNHGPGGITGLQPILPIPAGTEYLPGTARPAGALASLDGKTFQPIPLKRMVKGPDGKLREEEVPCREYRMLAWRLEVLDEKKSATFKARVRIMEDVPPSAPRS